MYSINPNYQHTYYNTVAPLKATKVNNAVSCSDKPNFTSNKVSPFAFLAASNPAPIRTELVTKQEKEMYNELVKISDKNTKKTLNTLLKNGKLLNADSNDKSTVLDNLYKIITNPRAEGLNGIVIMRDTVNAISNPFLITQQFGDIPEPYVAKATSAHYASKMKGEPSFGAAVPEEINVTHSGTCVAASVQFNLADKQPAEYARFVEGLSSPNVAVNKNIKFNNLADSTLDAVWLLNAFEIPYEVNDFENIKLTFAPDKNALLRAQIQTTHKDALERSAVDVLMQSTFMQVGSQQSYDSLTDKRAGKFNQNDKGLIEFEKTFTESVVEDKNKISVTYQTVDENAKLIGYETDFDTIKKQITESLKMGENVIIGYTQVDNSNTIVNGHEITIIGTKVGKDGKTIFICNDTDDNLSKSIEYTEDYLLPKIHHAALPKEVLESDMLLVENWVEGLKTYKELKKQTSENNQNTSVYPKAA